MKKHFVSILVTLLLASPASALLLSSPGGALDDVTGLVWLPVNGEIGAAPADRLLSTQRYATTPEVDDVFGRYLLSLPCAVDGLTPCDADSLQTARGVFDALVPVNPFWPVRFFDAVFAPTLTDSQTLTFSIGPEALYYLTKEGHALPMARVGALLVSDSLSLREQGTETPVPEPPTGSLFLVGAFVLFATRLYTERNTL